MLSQYKILNQACSNHRALFPTQLDNGASLSDIYLLTMDTTTLMVTVASYRLGNSPPILLAKFDPVNRAELIDGSGMCAYSLLDNDTQLLVINKLSQDGLSEAELKAFPGDTFFTQYSLGIGACSAKQRYKTPFLVSFAIAPIYYRFNLCSGGFLDEDDLLVGYHFAFNRKHLNRPCVDAITASNPSGKSEGLLVITVNQGDRTSSYKAKPCIVKYASVFS